MADTPRKPKCPICRKPVELRVDNEFFPFCSRRCQMEDLGNWLDEAYSLPVSHTSTERSLPKSAPSRESSDDGE